MRTSAALDDEDFYAWTQDQAEALRALARQRWNGPLDLEHLSEEVEELGRAAALELADQDGEAVAATLPTQPDYTLAQRLDEDWWPLRCEPLQP